MEYCYNCGTKLFLRFLDSEGDIPYCEKCGKFVFPIFSTAVSMIIQSPDKKDILLIRQYGRPDNILVAGYVNKGECAEDAVTREIREETGISVHNIKFNKSEYFAPSDTLMLNFSCVADNRSLDAVNTSEVDHAQWYRAEEAVKQIKPGSLAKRFLMSFLEKK